MRRLLDGMWFDSGLSGYSGLSRRVRHWGRLPAAATLGGLGRVLGMSWQVCLISALWTSHRKQTQSTHCLLRSYPPTKCNISEVVSGVTQCPHGLLRHLHLRHNVQSHPLQAYAQRLSRRSSRLRSLRPSKLTHTPTLAHVSQHPLSTVHRHWKVFGSS